MGFTKRHIHICLQEGYDKAFIEPNGELHAIHFMKDGKVSCKHCDPVHRLAPCPDHRTSFALVVTERQGRQVRARVLVGKWPMYREAARAALDKGFF